ncbi:MAG: hypothetical protein HYX69_22805 [Planctomycetia bacterium]|nr:hypothetical protein [Planctomycetia bacterium]
MTIQSTSETAIFERIVLAREAGISQDAPRPLLAFGFSGEDSARMRELSEKARQGSLTPDEQHAIDNYERVGHYLAILQSKARLALRDATDRANRELLDC